MNQFKDVFLGSGRRDYSRAADTQKCIRVSGKHNDLEEVGRDTYHHTFFEMLGNWSFGDYFKEDAIAWAWQLLTEVWKLPKERLWVTVFGGDPADKLPADDEAARDLDREDARSEGARAALRRKDNFWEMGESGPCGPCTEIHIDRGGPGTNPADGADRKIGVNAGNERFMELWNLVFIEFNRKADGSLERLPARHVDTGMGFERLVGVIQGKSSNYDTDVFRRCLDSIAKITGKTYRGELANETDVAFRVIADHVRALTSAVADGALPSNEGRGYVLRRLLRRAARFGTQNLGMEEPFIYRVVPAVAADGGRLPRAGRTRAVHPGTSCTPKRSGSPPRSNAAPRWARTRAFARETRAHRPGETAKIPVLADTYGGSPLDLNADHRGGSGASRWTSPRTSACERRAAPQKQGRAAWKGSGGEEVDVGPGSGVRPSRRKHSVTRLTRIRSRPRRGAASSRVPFRRGPPPSALVGG